MKKIIILAALIFAAVSCGSINDLKDIKEIQKVTTNVNVVTSAQRFHARILIPLSS